MFRLTLLGTGNAAGMPVYGCECGECNIIRSSGSGGRTPCSALLEFGDHRYLIDAGQVNLDKKFPAGSLNGIFVTHFHPDHVQGLFHLRWGTNLRIPVYAPPDSEGCADLYKHPGILDFNLQKKYQTFEVGKIRVTPLPLIHSKPTFGYLFEANGKSLAYLTDTKGLPPGTFDSLNEVELDVLVIDCSFMPGYDGKGHNNLDDVEAIQSRLKVRKVVLTHIGHDLHVWLKQAENRLQPSIEAGFDGMELSL